MDARTSKRQKKISGRQEKRLAKDLGGITMPASGAMSGAKGDVRAMGKVRAEAKYTSKTNYTLRLEELDKITREAGLENALLQLCFVDRAGRAIQQFAIVPLSRQAFQALLRADYQTRAKSMKLDRDQLTLKLLNKDAVYVVFTEHKKGLAGFSQEHRWFRIMKWKIYLIAMEELDA